VIGILHAGVKLTWNLFNGFRTREQIRQADAEERAKRFELAEKKSKLLKQCAMEMRL
jgi:outer membrane protein TolC